MAKATTEAVSAAPLDRAAAVAALNRILHVELDGVMQHFHHRWISRWLRPSRARAIAVGQLISSLTEEPSIGVGQLIEEALTGSDRMLAAVRGHEQRRVDEYRRLLELVEGRQGCDELEAFARAQLEGAESESPA